MLNESEVRKLLAQYEKFLEEKGYQLSKDTVMLWKGKIDVLREILDG